MGVEVPVVGVVVPAVEVVVPELFPPPVGVEVPVVDVVVPVVEVVFSVGHIPHTGLFAFIKADLSAKKVGSELIFETHQPDKF